MVVRWWPSSDTCVSYHRWSASIVLLGSLVAQQRHLCQLPPVVRQHCAPRGSLVAQQRSGTCVSYHRWSASIVLLGSLVAQQRHLCQLPPVVRQHCAPRFAGGPAAAPVSVTTGGPPALCSSVRWWPSSDTCVSYHRWSASIVLLDSLVAQQRHLCQLPPVVRQHCAPRFAGGPAAAPVSVTTGGPPALCSSVRWWPSSDTCVEYRTEPITFHLNPTSTSWPSHQRHLCQLGRAELYHRWSARGGVQAG